jgi:hypothetical protein
MADEGKKIPPKYFTYIPNNLVAHPKVNNIHHHPYKGLKPHTAKRGEGDLGFSPLSNYH